MWRYTAYTQILQDGEYEVEIVRTSLSTSRHGYPMARVMLKCGRFYLWDNVVLSEKTQEHANGFRDAFGLGDAFSTVELARAIGRRATAIVYIDRWGGREINRIGRYIVDPPLPRSKSKEPQSITNYLP